MILRVGVLPLFLAHLLAVGRAYFAASSSSSTLASFSCSACCYPVFPLYDVSSLLLSSLFRGPAALPLRSCLSTYCRLSPTFLVVCLLLRAYLAATQVL